MSSSEDNSAHERWVWEMNRRDAERQHDREDAFMQKAADAAISMAQAALRTAVLINGGAAIALLAFIGGLFQRERIVFAQLEPMAESLIWFAWGVAAAAFALGFAYLTNYFTGALIQSRTRTWEHPYVRPEKSTKRWNWVVQSLQILAVVAGIGSLVLFIWGMIAVGDALTNLR